MLAETSTQPAYAYLALSAALFGVWLALYLARRGVRREMVRVSLGTMPLGLTEAGASDERAADVGRQGSTASGSVLLVLGHH